MVSGSFAYLCTFASLDPLVADVYKKAKNYFEFTHTHARTHAHTHTRTHTHTHARTHARARTHTHTHTHTSQKRPSYTLFSY